MDISLDNTLTASESQLLIKIMQLGLKRGYLFPDEWIEEYIANHDNPLTQDFIQYREDAIAVLAKLWRLSAASLAEDVVYPYRSNDEIIDHIRMAYKPARALYEFSSNMMNSTSQKIVNFIEAINSTGSCEIKTLQDFFIDEDINHAIEHNRIKIVLLYGIPYVQIVGMTQLDILEE